MKRRGFTLIELLTVILILGIVALIAIPTVNKIIKKAKEGAVRSSAIAYINAVEDYLAICKISDCDVQLVAGQTYQVSAEKYEAVSIIDYLIPKVYAEELPSETIINDLVNLKGTMPTSGVIVIGNDSNIDSAALFINGYIVEYNKDNGIISIVKDSNIPVQNINIANDNVSLSKGDTLQLNMQLEPEDASRRKIQWLSSDESVVTVSSTGLITAVGIGEAEISVTAASGKTDSIFVEITGFVKQLSAGYDHLLIKDKNNKLWTCGQNDYGQLCTGNTTNSSILKKINSSLSFNSIYGGDYMSFEISTDNNLYACGTNGYSRLGISGEQSQLNLVQVNSGTKYKAIIDDKNASTYAIDINDNLWSWGLNDCGQLGTGNTTNTVTPVPIKSGTKFKMAIPAYYYQKPFICALDTDNNIWCWGDNSYGQLGINSTTKKNVPTQVDTTSKFKEIYMKAQSQYILALDVDNNLWGWGKNDLGQLGVENTTNQLKPTQIKPGTKFKKVKIGLNFNLAIDEDNNLWSWGYNYYGQLGTGNKVNQPKPIQIQVGTKFIDFEAVNSSIYAIDENNNLWVCGNNNNGQLGTGNTTELTILTKITSSIIFKKIYSNSSSSIYAIDTDGKLWAWGENNYGQLGLNSTTNQLTPKEVSFIE